MQSRISALRCFAFGYSKTKTSVTLLQGIRLHTFEWKGTNMLLLFFAGILIGLVVGFMAFTLIYTFLA